MGDLLPTVSGGWVGAVLRTPAQHSHRLDLRPRGCSSLAVPYREGELTYVPKPTGLRFLFTQSTIKAAFRRQNISINIKYRASAEKLHFTVASVIASKWVSHQLWEKQVSAAALQRDSSGPLRTGCERQQFKNKQASKQTKWTFRKKPILFP